MELDETWSNKWLVCYLPMPVVATHNLLSTYHDFMQLNRSNLKYNRVLTPLLSEKVDYMILAPLCNGNSLTNSKLTAVGSKVY